MGGDGVCRAPDDSRQHYVGPANQPGCHYARDRHTGGPGAPGATNCRTINGTLGNVDVKIRGWYCPSTGRIHFVHRNLDSGDAVRVFTGNVSDQVAGQPLSMAGTMTVLISAFGDLGEYNFSATTD